MQDFLYFLQIFERQTKGNPPALALGEFLAWEFRRWASPYVVSEQAAASEEDEVAVGEHGERAEDGREDC